MSTNNAPRGNGEPEAWTFRPAWRRGQRCVIPAQDFDEPYWGTGKYIWWRFSRADGAGDDRTRLEAAFREMLNRQYGGEY